MQLSTKEKYWYLKNSKLTFVLYLEADPLSAIVSLSISAMPENESK